MFCKNCGNEMDPNASFCVRCGAMKGVGQKYCANCGAELPVNATACVRCGCLAAGPAPNQAQSGAAQKSKLAAGLLGIFLGALGIHNFYLGYTGKAVAQLLISVCTCGIGAAVTGVWGLIEGILILTGSIAVDGKGVPIKKDL